MNQHCRSWLALPVAVFLFSLARFACAGDSGLVKVDLGDVRADVAKTLQMEASQVPSTVQAPIEVAAAVCAVSPAILTNVGQDQPAACKATSTSSALNDIVQKQVAFRQ